MSALGTFFLAMVQNPDIQKKAQKAIDDVVGHDRLPDFTDSIPYVDAIVKEVSRWRPVVPLGTVYVLNMHEFLMSYQHWQLYLIE